MILISIFIDSQDLDDLMKEIKIPDQELMMQIQIE